jgi:hypothetical protein
MHIDLDSFSEPELKEQLDRYMRLFDVAHGALLRLSDVQLDAESLRKQIADILQILDSYPNHPAFKS